MTKEISLTQGKVTIVDDEDYEYLIRSKWCAHKTPKGEYYAVRQAFPFGLKHSVTLKMHREIMDCPDNMVVDHINHDPLDNRRCNLRICTSSENGRNAKKPSNNTSGYKGVCFNKRNKLWESSIQTNNKKRLHLGLFDNIIEAAYAYDEAAIYHHQSYALLNFPTLTSDDRNVSNETWNKIKGLKLPIKHRNNTSGYRGVAYDKRMKLWKCSVYSNKKRYHLGYFKCPIYAALIYDENAILKHGDKAYLNYPLYI